MVKAEAEDKRLKQIANIKVDFEKIKFDSNSVTVAYTDSDSSYANSLDGEGCSSSPRIYRTLSAPLLSSVKTVDSVLSLVHRRISGGDASPPLSVFSCPSEPEKWTKLKIFLESKSRTDWLEKTGDLAFTTIQGIMMNNKGNTWRL